MEKDKKNIWKIISFPLLYIGAQLIVSIIYVVIIAIPVAFKSATESASSGDFFHPEYIYDLLMSDINLLVPLIISVFVTFLVIFLIQRKEWKTDRFWSFAGLKVSTLALCLFLGAAMNILTIFILAMLGINQEPSVFDEILGNNFMIEFLAISIFAPVLEEITFRGIVLKRLSKMTGKHTAVFLQALIFGVIHLNLLQGTYTFFLAIFIGYIYLWFDSIWYAIAIHLAYNGINIALFYLLGDSKVDMFYFLVIAFVVFVVSMVSLVALAEQREKEKEREDFRNSL